MPPRAMWKGTIRFGDLRVPVKLYAAARDRTVRFRLLHAEDRVPVQQKMVNPETDRPVERADTLRGLELDRGLFVVLRPEELDALEPEPSRDIRISRFLDAGAIGPHWYDRPYYLGPDGSPGAYRAFARALSRRGKEGVARWVMRKKAYVGALQSHEDHLVLLTLRWAEEVIPADRLEPPTGRELEARERTRGERFIGALEDTFDPSAYEDRYRERVIDLIELKRRGGTVEIPEREEKEAPEGLADLLEESLARLA